MHQFFKRTLIPVACIFAVATQTFAQATASKPASKPDTSLIRFGEAAKPRTPGTIRVATYNLMNFFDSDPATRTHSEGEAAAVKPEGEREAAAGAIRAINADIVALEEVESLPVVKAFIVKYLADMGYDHAVLIESEDPRGIDNAIISRFPIVHSEAYDARPLGGKQPALEGNRPNPLAGNDMKFRRSPLRADIKIPGKAFGGGDDESYELTLLAVHHKSGRWSEYWRLAEANGVLAIVKEIEAKTPAANIIVLGDCNAQVTDAPIKAYLEGGLIDSFAAKAAKWSPAIVSHESGRRIDLILLNKNASEEFVADSPFIFGMPARPEGADWRTTPPPEGYASDHYPVVIDLKPGKTGAANPKKQ
ncbi:MAG: endonuclease/exonuclease/phosphatase family protein [Phycisphaerales bacterium]|nr:endonuclease/exonuclease/phosphatase family protein [Phycisphaerales bacterium]